MRKTLLLKERSPERRSPPNRAKPQSAVAHKPLAPASGSKIPAAARQPFELRKQVSGALSRRDGPPIGLSIS
jgi:hypothetical protein